MTIIVLVMFFRGSGAVRLGLTIIFLNSRQSLITSLKTHIGTENNYAVWFFLSTITEHVDIKDPLFVLEYFYENVLNAQQVSFVLSEWHLKFILQVFCKCL